MTMLRDPKVQGALRHLLSSLGPLLAAHGFTTNAYWQAVVGAGMAAVAFYTSVTAPEKQKGRPE